MRMLGIFAFAIGTGLVAAMVAQNFEDPQEAAAQRQQQAAQQQQRQQQQPDTCGSLRAAADTAEGWAGSARQAIGMASMTTRIEMESHVRDLEIKATDAIAEWTRRCN